MTHDWMNCAVLLRQIRTPRNCLANKLSGAYFFYKECKLIISLVISLSSDVFSSPKSLTCLPSLLFLLISLCHFLLFTPPLSSCLHQVNNDFIKSGEFTLERMGVTYKAKAHLKSPFDPENKRVKGIYA